jgi:hypothetical protein
MRRCAHAWVVAGVWLTALAAPAWADPPSPDITLIAPAEGSVVEDVPGQSLTLRFSVNWAAIKAKQGNKVLFAALGLRPQGYNGVLFGDTVTQGQTSKTFTFDQINAELKKRGLPLTTRMFWDVMVRPAAGQPPGPMDRTEGTFGLSYTPRRVRTGKPGVIPGLAQPASEPARAAP